MRIGIDIMGGDYAPRSTISGSFLALDDLPDDTNLVFYGNQKSILQTCTEEGFDADRISIVHCPETISMADHPYKSFASKKESGIYKAFHDLKSDQIDAFCSAGNTGAMMIGATQVINSIPGIIRPAIAANLPNLKNKPSILLDVGINPDTRPDVLYQYGLIGKAYARSLNGIKNPRVGLVNIGKEEEKGNLTVKSAYQLMSDTDEYHFIGNVEGHELLIDPLAEVLVCDGFAGNIILKEAESFYQIIKSRKIDDDFFEMFNFENFGGTAILGVNKPVIVGHGISGPKAIKNMIIHSRDVYINKLITFIKKELE